jgi:hypothetical protein
MAPKRKAPSWLKAVVPIRKVPHLSLPVVRDGTASSTPSVPSSGAASSSGTGASALAVLSQPTHLLSVPARPSLPTAVLAVRHDAPKTTSRIGRGCKPTTPLTDADRVALLAEYEEDTRTRSARNAVESNWKSWQFYHVRWFGDAVPVLPVTTDSIKAVVSQLKRQGYLSVGNLIGAAKDKHLDAKFSWNEFLLREAKRATRSGVRGRGSARQDEELDVDAAFSLHLSDDPVVPRGPCGFTRALEIGSFHVLREIELSLALASSVAINLETSEETFSLPASKTDPRAIGCCRTWGCVCDGTHSTPCAYHAMLDQLSFLKRKFPDVPFDQLPLFPKEDGQTVAKADVVKSICKVAELLGEPLTDQLGRNRYGGHTLRVSGARRLARLAIPTASIMLLARWASLTILRYIQDAPLKGLTLEYRKRSAAASSYSLFAAASMIGSDGRKAMLEYDETYKAKDALLLALQARLDAIDVKLEVPKYVLNDKSGILHRADSTGTFATAESRCTPCGWRYGTCPSTLVKTVPDSCTHKRICSRCLPSLRAELSSAARIACSASSHSDDSESSSDSVSSSSA